MMPATHQAERELEAPAAMDDFATRAERALEQGAPESVSHDELVRVLTAATRLYAAKAEEDAELPALDGARITPTDVVVTVTGMLRAARLNLWDLSMWFQRGSRG
jgi:hypothetical protein